MSDLAATGGDGMAQNSEPKFWTLTISSFSNELKNSLQNYFSVESCWKIILFSGKFFYKKSQSEILRQTWGNET